MLVALLVLFAAFCFERRTSAVVVVAGLLMAVMVGILLLLLRPEVLHLRGIVLPSLISLMRPLAVTIEPIWEFAQANAQSSLQFTSELMACRTPADFMRVTQEQSKKQMETFQQQAK